MYPACVQIYGRNMLFILTFQNITALRVNFVEFGSNIQNSKVVIYKRSDQNRLKLGQKSIAAPSVVNKHTKATPVVNCVKH